MQVLISDTNVWIDLHHGGLLEAAFSLPYQYVTTEFVAIELDYPPGKDLIGMGLVVVPLASKEVQQLASLKITLRNSSLADVSCYLLAQLNPGWRLLTGDGSLRKAAKQAGLTCNGVLWLLDELYVAHPKKGKELCNALRGIMARGAFLPEDECLNRLNKWDPSEQKR
jgi:hypothetical protein